MMTVGPSFDSKNQELYKRASSPTKYFVRKGEKGDIDDIILVNRLLYVENKGKWFWLDLGSISIRFTLNLSFVIILLWTW